MSDFEQHTRALLDTHGETLLRLAAASIEHGLAHDRPLMVNLDDYPEELLEIRGCFVTLKKHGALRGCIGTPVAHLPLIEDVTENAFSAAFRDPRFPKLERSELADLSLDISVLSPSMPMTIASESDLLGQLRPGIDGLIISDDPYHALFLPAVWRNLPDPAHFLAHLKAKAGMSVDHWSDTFRARRFIAVEIHGRDLDEALFSA